MSSDDRFILILVASVFLFILAAELIGNEVSVKNNCENCPCSELVLGKGGDS